MNNQNTEPRILFTFKWGLVEFHLSLLEGQVKPKIFHVSNAIKRNLSLTFDQKNRVDLDIFDVSDFTKIVDVVVHTQLVHAAMHLKANWFIMIAMYRKYRHLNIKSCIHIIGILVVVSFEGYSLLRLIASRCTEDLIIEYFWSLVVALLCWPQIMEQIPTQ